MKEINQEELAKLDGKIGPSTYISHGGRVFDVTESKLWRGGNHMSLHRAGKDLTAELQAAPHGAEVLERYPQVAIFKNEAASARALPQIIARLLGRFPMLKRHPHPMTVHFPIVFMFATAFFTFLYLLSGKRDLEVTALHCLGMGLLFTPLAMVTGYYTWWLNYLARPLRPVTIKIRLSLLLFGIALITFLWRWFVPDILLALRPASIIYLLLVFSLFPLVAVLGWYGAGLTFPVDKE